MGNHNNPIQADGKGPRPKKMMAGAAYLGKEPGTAQGLAEGRRDI